MKSNFHNLRQKNIHVLGVSGSEGWAVLDFFLKLGFENITAHDFITKSSFKKNFIKNHPGYSKQKIKKSLLKFANYRNKIKIFFKENYLQQIEEADFIFVPQSWFLYAQNKGISKLSKKNTFLGLMNIYFNLSSVKLIGITGSQGKTTTSRLVHHILRTAGESIYYGGNDKKAIQCLSKLLKMKEKDFLILEISHRHLRFLDGRKNFSIFKKPKARPYIAVILNINKNHLDEVKDFKEYQEIKSRILSFQGKKDSAILNYDDLLVRRLSKKTKGKVMFFSKEKILRAGVFLDKKDNFLKIRARNKEIKILRTEDLSLQARHHLDNVLAAIAVAFLAKIKVKIIKKGIQTFSWSKNCFEYLGDFEGIKYYNNLASTTPEATELAIKTIIFDTGHQLNNGDLILISGGDDKNMSYQSLVRSVRKNVKYSILFPDTGSKKIKQALGRGKVRFTKTVQDLKGASKVIKKIAKEGDIVLLSPSGAFFQTKYGKRRDFLKYVTT